MSRSTCLGICIAAILCTAGVLFLPTQPIAQVVSLDPAKMPIIGTVDDRFNSYNIEMVEVIGGKFWKPYASSAASSPKAHEPARQEGFTPAGIDPSLYEYRAPIDLANRRLRKLAAALGPAYVRVSGTWANSVYFQDSEYAAPANAPSGFSGVLTREEWKGLVDFSHAVNAEIVTSVATGPSFGSWEPWFAEILGTGAACSFGLDVSSFRCKKKGCRGVKSGLAQARESTP